MGVIDITNEEAFLSFVSNECVSVIHFYTDWASQCATMNESLEELSKKHAFKFVKFGKCDPEKVPKVALQYRIQAVPTFLILKNNNLIETINGADMAKVTSVINRLEGTNMMPPSSNLESEETKLETRLKQLISLSDVMVFMKGDPSTPRCGFSRTLVTILNSTGVPYQTFDILSDEDVRQGLKKFSNWPTYPQVYVKGELIGGLDIIQELNESGELKSALLPK